MRRLAFALSFLLLTALSLAAAGLSTTSKVVLMSGIGGLYGGEIVNCNFVTQKYYGANNCALTFSRASSKFCEQVNGDWIQVPTGIPCISSKGYLSETQSINQALWARDWTNAAWAATNITTALNATGIDCTLNSATTLTASAGNATILQSITLASNTDTFSVFIKCVTCTGAISIVADGLTFTDVSSSLNSTTFTRVSVTTAALVNPIIGIQITNSGDSIVVDFGQLEIKSWPTSPMWSLGTAFTRPADVARLTQTYLFPTAVTLLGQMTPLSPITNAANQRLAMIDDGSTTNQINFIRNTNIMRAQNVSDVTGTTQLTPAGAWAQNLPAKIVIATALNDQAAVFNNGTVVTAATGAVPSNLNTIRIGNIPNGTLQPDAYIGQIAVWNYRVSNTRIKQFSTSP